MRVKSPLKLDERALELSTRSGSGHLRIAVHSPYAVQTAFNFDAATRSRRGSTRNRESVEEAARVLPQILVRLCARGHCAVPEHQLLTHSARQTRLDRGILLSGLRRAIRQCMVACEVVDGEPWLFPREVREAELTIARRARQLAEGAAIARGKDARLEKLSFLCSANHHSTVEFVIRLLSRMPSLGYSTVVLVPGTTEAHWFRLRLARPVLDVAQWLRRGAQVPDTLAAQLGSVQGMPDCLFVILDASRLDIESMAELLEALPQESALAMVGNPNETPCSGHGQSFRDLVYSNLFQCLSVQTPVGVSTGGTATLVPRLRRSALCWRLRRSAGLNILKR